MSDFTPDRHGIGEMLCADFMVAEMRHRAEDGKEFAEAIAPFDPTDKRGFHYNELFRVESGIQDRKTRRAYGALINDHPAAYQIEFGTHDTPRHRTLGRALDIMGGGE